ncbi:MAG TPA: glutathione synthase [Paenalcaligenes hominis]|uniref:Glutathione synthetase n=1 Tax=Paenalcaligenes hominis TaxID=643674 RepID=A0A1U9JXI8_9BURK|nr:glutathione synthase [Paenalcaligenes hominis]AQS50474.1 glutathione synthase [Paenalcaligenes hominis]HJH25085.1 glutathione synthase [Paenalcaligenes hominis]
MHVLFIIDPLPSLSAYKDTSVAMMRALLAQEHTISVALQTDLYIDQGRVKTVAQPIHIAPSADLHAADWWTETGPALELELNHFSAVIMRKDPPFDMEYFYSTHLLSFAEEQGAKVFNTGAALRNHPEKLAITEFPEFTPPTLVTRDMKRIRAFHQEYKDVIVKPLDGMGGMGIFRMREGEVNVGAILETLSKDGTETLMVQRYIPEISAGDKRILIINGRPVPYCLARIPLAGETRGNLAAGGRGVAQPLSERDWQIANTVAPRLAERGLFLVGLDVIGDYITEVNVTSPTCFVEITEQTDCDVGALFAKALADVVANA